MEGTAIQGRRRRALTGALALAGAAGFAAGWFFPRAPGSSAPHEAGIDRAASEFGVDRSLVRAVVLAESGGQADAVSRAGAVGLMQLLPATARERAQELGVDSYDLADPDTNLRLGTCHLARLLGFFDGDIALAVAAYNAGGSRVMKWAEAAPDMTGRGVVEANASAETRRYVERVLQFSRDSSQSRTGG